MTRLLQIKAKRIDLRDKHEYCSGCMFITLVFRYLVNRALLPHKFRTVLQVLATGLSGLYSSLPRKLTISADDWYRLTDEDVNNMNDLVHFLNSLQFCNAVVQV